jgi:hypothetical protein
MAASQYYSVSARVGVPHRNEVEVTIPTVGPAGPQGPAGEGGGGDLTSPGPIGSVAPNTGAFTTLSATGVATLPHIHGSLAGNLYIHVKNTSGGQLTRGTPVYIVGNVGDTDRVEVAAADFDDATKMPAVGLLEQTLANNGSGDAIILGELDEANTNAYTINTELFVGNNGALTSTRPTTGQVQSVGVVARVNSNTGVIVVNMQGQRGPNEAFAAASHTHGNLTNAGAIGTTSGLPVKTGTSGVLEAGAFGTAAGQFAEGNHTHAASAITSGTLDNARINFAAPPAIGNTTPNTIAGTQLALHDGSDTGTFVAASKLSANRTYDLPDASGTLALNPMTTAGDIVVGGTSGAPARLALGTASQQLRVNSGATSLEYFTPAAGGTKTYAVFTAEHNQPPATAFATLDTRNSIAVLDFDDTTDESAVFVGIIPEAASLGSGLNMRLHWMATTATSGNVVWDVSLERMTTDLDSDSFDTIASGTAAANGTSGILTVTEITLTTIDSVTAGDGFRLKVTRDANNASDTMTGDAELVVCEVRSAA